MGAIRVIHPNYDVLVSVGLRLLTFGYFLQEINELLGGSPLHTSATEICSAFATSAEELQRLLADPRAAAAMGSSPVTDSQLRCVPYP